MVDDEKRQSSVGKWGKIVLAIVIWATLLLLLMPTSPPGIRRKAIAARLALWVPERMAVSRDLEEVFLPEGRHELCSEYGLYVFVRTEATEMEKTPALTAKVQYGDLEDGSIVMILDSGEKYKFRKRTFSLERTESLSTVDRSAWKTVYLYVYGPTR